MAEHTSIERALDDAQRYARRFRADYVVYHSDLIGWCTGRAMPGDDQIAEFVMVRCPEALRHAPS